MRVIVIKIGIMVRETTLEILEVEDKAEEILEAISEVKVEEEVDLIRVQMLEG